MLRGDMGFFKSWCFMSLAIFFVNYMMPGIEVTSLTKLPHLGIDFPFAMILGLLNLFIYKLCSLIESCRSFFQIVVSIFVLNLVVYAVLKFSSIGISIVSLEGYLLGTALVSIVSGVLNFYLFKSTSQSISPPPLT
jgi:uncharacterized membrane protein YvlD (DUF360 family)